MTGRASVVVVGGGIAGVSLAYYLSLRVDGVVVVESQTLGGGMTAASFGGVRQQFSTPLEIELSKRGLAFWRSLEHRLDAPRCFRDDGYLLVTADGHRFARLLEAAELQRAMGAGPVETLDAGEVGRLVPWLATDGLAGGTWTPHDGRVTATDGVAALARACRRAGVRIAEHCHVHEIAPSRAGWRVRTAAEELDCDHVVVAAGLGTVDLLAPLGFRLAISRTPLHYGLSGPVPFDTRFPLTLDLDTGLCVEREGDGVLVSVLREDPPPGWSAQAAMEVFASVAARRAPDLLAVGLRATLSADADLTPDGHPYAGRLATGLWVLAGFAGHGVMHAPAVAELLARHLTDGEPDLDLSPLAPLRSPGETTAEWMVASRTG